MQIFSTCTLFFCCPSAVRLVRTVSPVLGQRSTDNGQRTTVNGQQTTEDGKRLGERPKRGNESIAQRQATLRAALWVGDKGVAPCKACKGKSPILQV